MARLNHASAARTAFPQELTDRVDGVRLEVSRHLPAARRAELGQFMTPAAVARFMASMLRLDAQELRVLDAGAGIGSLTAALVERVSAREVPPRRVTVDAWEIDPPLASRLRETLDACAAHASSAGVRFHAEVHREDFLASGVAMLDGGLFARTQSFNVAILNPPYHKLRSDSDARTLLRRIGLEASNLYAGFVAVALDLLEPGGELVAITPRSFCNGPYFRPFRDRLLGSVALKRIHVFERRDHAFRDDDVLQETVIYHVIKAAPQGDVVVSRSEGPDDTDPVSRVVPFDQVVHGDDPERIIHVVTDDLGRAVGAWMERLDASLDDLDVEVSTGRVVDFRARESLVMDPAPETAPLIYPQHLERGGIAWPRPGSKKPNAIRVSDATAALLLPRGVYVVTKRFSSKEERRRIVASVFDPAQIPGSHVGFENHLNVFHRHGAGLPLRTARGLCAWLNSTLIDEHFRSWSGHTQVNATDLRKMKWPPLAGLDALGEALASPPDTQEALDELVERVLFPMTDEKSDEINPVAAKRRIDEATQILKAVGLPAEQQNERSALTLLALAALTPRHGWHDATAPMRGITPMMEFFAEQYGKRYAPNTRETVRRFTVHQFVDAGIALENPDNPKRPTNSPKAVYQLAPTVLELLRAFGTDAWEEKLGAWLGVAGALAARYALERKMALVPVEVAPGERIELSPGDHSALIREIMTGFCPRYTPGAKVIYVGDTSAKWAYFDQRALKELGVAVDEHGKMPDVVVHHVKLDWLVLIEAVTSHGPVNGKRREELAELFKESRAGLVFVTAFPDRKVMTRYLGEISWETEVWVADAPSHMIHFNGERFLGPY